MSPNTNLAHLDPLEALASCAGENWANEFARQLRETRRTVAGGWPGTLTEARTHVLAALAGRGRGLSTEHLGALSRTAYRAARAAWRLVADMDEEQ